MAGPDVLADAAAHRTRTIVESLRHLDGSALLAPSRLDGWSRLTIACHLRYGAQALSAMTAAALEGRPASYYPEGRDVQRPRTLVPDEGETPTDVIDSLQHHSEELQRLWSTIGGDGWDREVVEPHGKRDLGPLPLSRLPLLRLTEVEVHGSDLDVGRDDWSAAFVDTALPFRLDWLNTRRTNHRAVNEGVQGSWLLHSTDGPTYLVSVLGASVESHPAAPSTQARAKIEGTSRDLLALLLGRPTSELRITGDVAFGEQFSQAFPGP